MSKINTNALFRSVDNSPLIIFRIIFGFLIVAESWGAIMTGWVSEVFIETPFNFSFIGFEWLSVLHGEWMYYYFFLMGIVGILIMIGLFYRASVVTFIIMWSAVYLAQKVHYNNHYYLLMLLSMLMAIVPANAYKSFDASKNPDIKSTTCPQWCLWIFAVQISLVYFFGGIAKIYPDWIEAKPIAMWFRSKSSYFLIGPLLAKQWFQVVISYAGIAFDTLIVPALIWRRTRQIAFVATIFFHVFNSIIFQVGIFPYLGIAFGLFFFAPEVISNIFFKNKEVENNRQSYSANKWVVTALALWFAIQVALPIRHWFYASNVHWTEEGHRLAWHMMLRIKYGYVSFRVIDIETKKEWVIKPNEFLSVGQAGDVAAKPDICWQFVQWLKEHYKQQGINEIAIYATGKASLNGNGYAPLYNSEINLAAVKWERFEHSGWLLPYPH